jgi:SOS response regulatory protein OraA/RecX
MDSNNKDKFHFFIGNIFNNEQQQFILRKVQKKLKQKYFLKDTHWNNNFFTNILYLGYFDNETAQIYMTNIMEPLL